MALAAIIKEETFKSLPEALQAEYKKQDDGTFLLDVSPVNGLALEDVSGLKSALSKERTSVEDLNKKLKAFEGIDPEKAGDALKKLDEMKNWSPEEKVKQQIEAVKQQLVEKHTGELSAKNERIGGLTSQVEKLLIESAAIKALAENKGSTELLLPHVKSCCKLKENDKGEFEVVVVDAGGNPRISAASGSTANMTIAERVAEMKTQDAFAAAFEGSGASGSGAGGSGASRKTNSEQDYKEARENGNVLGMLKNCPEAS